MKLVLAARQSDLARLQAYETGKALQAAYKKSDLNLGGPLEIEYRFRSSLGDQRGDDPLWKMPEKGVFTEDFLADLESGKVDLVVHSWKDLPVQERASTLIAATLPRADVRDVILVRRDHWDARKSGAESGPFRVLTSSPRRSYCLQHVLEWALPWSQCLEGRPEIQFVPVRGNIATRVGKINQAHALVVAKAALDRLLMSSKHSDLDSAFSRAELELKNALEKLDVVVLPLSVNPTAAAQGALAIEIRKNHEELLKLCRLIDSPLDRAAVEEERKILAGYGGGCHQKIGITVLNRPFGKIHFLRGLTDSGLRLEKSKLTGGRSRRFRRSAVWAGEGIQVKRQALSLQQVREDLSAYGEQQRTGYLVSRNEALPQGLDTAGKFIWAAGLATWKKLTSRGVWVHGSSEGLGEDERQQLDTLAGGEISWIRLTHEAALQRAEPAEATAATYQARYELVQPELVSHAEIFFWKSAGHFEAVFAFQPQLFKPRCALHAVGPGRTLKYVTARLKEAGWSKEDLKTDLFVVLNERELTDEID